MNRKKIFSVLSSAAMFATLNITPMNVNAENQKIYELEQQKEELQRKSNELLNGINSAEQEMNSLDTEREGLMQEIGEVQANIAELLQEISAQEEEIARLEAEIEQLNKEIEILQEKIEERDRVLAAQARGIQTSATPQDVIDIVLSAESLTDLLGKVEVVSSIVKNNNSIMEDQIRDQELVESHKAEVDLAKAESIQVKEVMEENHVNLEAQKVSLDEKVAYVSEKYNLTAAERDSLLSNQNTLASQANEIQKEIQTEKNRLAAEKARREEEARRAAEAAAVAKAEADAAAKRQAQAQVTQEKRVETASSSKAPATSAPTTSAPTTSAPAPAPQPSAPSNGGGWARPASGRVTSEFGYRIHPIYGTRRLHAGIDIGGGGTITAAKSGTVTYAGWHPTFGNYVRIDHGGGISTIYAHMLSNLGVSAGQSVSQGQRLGTMGSTGASTGVHLHFEVHQNGQPVNPRNFVSF